MGGNLSSELIDDGWDVAKEPAPEPRAKTTEELIREALTILDGEAPEELELSGDGWSLAGEPVPADAEPKVPVVAIAAAREVDPLAAAIGAALDVAESEGWMLADEEAA